MTPQLSATELERFRAGIAIAGPDECWPWTREVNNRGYGRFTIYAGNTRRRILTHRLALVLSGADVGTSEVLHSCDNPPCCNLAHLRAGTHQANMAEMAERGRASLSTLKIGQLLRPSVIRAHGMDVALAEAVARAGGTGGASPCKGCATPLVITRRAVAVPVGTKRHEGRGMCRTCYQREYRRGWAA